MKNNEIRSYLPVETLTAGEGLCEKVCKFETEKQLLSPTFWKKIVNQFRLHPDSQNNGWRGEYWGKLMRGACMICKVTGDDALYRVLTDSVQDLLTTQELDGSFSSYQKGENLRAWDIWCRKYIMLGMEHYLEICRDDAFSKQVLAALTAHADALVLRLGDGENKVPITKTCSLYGGMNSSSILEPMMILYRLTGKESYLSFSKHILSNGFCSSQNILQAALENKTDPYTWNETKAYEMMSCFEGALEYAEITGETKYRDAALNFGYRVLKSEITVIGCCGTLSEFFDHSAIRQTHAPIGIIQETCVTVTWMKLCRRLFAHSGNPIFLDSMEQSFYNAFLGSVNTEEKYSTNIHQPQYNTSVPSFLAFDSYSPLIPGERGVQTGGAQILEDGSIFGCCAAIAPAGAAILPQSILWKNENGILLAFYEPGKYSALTPNGQKMTVTVCGNYPTNLRLKISLKLEVPETFTFSVRIPAWSSKTKMAINGEKQNTKQGILSITQTWRDGDVLTLDLDDSLRMCKAPVYEKDFVKKMDWNVGKMMPVQVEERPEDRNFAAFFRGPLTLGTDSLLYNDKQGVIPFFQFNRDNNIEKAQEISMEKLPFPTLYAIELFDANKKRFVLTDYSSVGKRWQESLCCAWIPCKFSDNKLAIGCDLS